MESGIAGLATPALTAMTLTGYHWDPRKRKSSMWCPSEHLLFLDKIVTRAMSGFGPRILVIQSPPRHGKSEFGTHWTPVNFLTRFPDRRVMINCYESTLAGSWGRKVRNTIDANSGRLGISVASDKSAASDWNIQDREGGLLSSGAKGAMTGRGADLLILDDLIKNHEEALSDDIRRSRWEGYQSNASTRVEPGGLTIFIGTRWHEEDPPGMVLKQAEDGGPPVTLIDLPALALENDILGRKPGDALWPQRWSKESLLARKSALDVYWWESLYQQRPGRHGNSEWPDSYWDNILVDYMPPTFSLGSIAVDPSKGKDARKGDYSAIVYIGVHDGIIYVDSTVRRRPSEQIVSDGIDHATKYGEHMHAFGVETNQFQELLVGEFERQTEERKLVPLPLYMINNTVNKKLRISRLGPYLARRKIRFLNTPDNKLLIQQLKTFSMKDQAGVHDDGPDALEMAIRVLVEAVLNGSVQDDGFGDDLTDMEVEPND